MRWRLGVDVHVLTTQALLVFCQICRRCKDFNGFANGFWLQRYADFLSTQKKDLVDEKRDWNYSRAEAERAFLGEGLLK